MKAARRDELMIVVNEINNLIGSLSRYDEVGVQHWDPILANLLLRKIDEETLGRWKHERPPRDVAALADRWSQPPQVKAIDNQKTSA